jgi:hypothetical protein
MLQCSKMVRRMAEFEQMGDAERARGGWRAIGSAWLLVLLVGPLFVGFSALAKHYEAWNRTQPPQAHLVVPHHNPALDPREMVAAPPLM